MICCLPGRILQQSQASDGQNTSNEVDAFDNRDTRETFSARVIMREICEQQAQAYDAVEYERTPWSPTPANSQVTMRPQFDVKKVWAKRKNKCGHQGKRIASELHRYDFGEPISGQSSRVALGQISGLPSESS
jgi:hypothetical protein